MKTSEDAPDQGNPAKMSISSLSDGFDAEPSPLMSDLSYFSLVDEEDFGKGNADGQENQEAVDEGGDNSRKAEVKALRANGTDDETYNVSGIVSVGNRIETSESGKSCPKGAETKEVASGNQSGANGKGEDVVNQAEAGDPVIQTRSQADQSRKKYLTKWKQLIGDLLTQHKSSIPSRFWTRIKRELTMLTFRNLSHFQSIWAEVEEECLMVMNHLGDMEVNSDRYARHNMIVFMELTRIYFALRKDEHGGTKYFVRASELLREIHKTVRNKEDLLRQVGDPQVNAELERLRRELQSTKKELGNSNYKIAEQANTICQQAQENEQLRKDFEAQRLEIQDLEEENQCTVAELANAHGHYMVLKDQFNEFVQETDALKATHLEQMTKANENHERTKIRLKETSTKYDHMKNAARRYKNELAALREVSGAQDANRRKDIDGLLAQKQVLKEAEEKLKKRESQVKARESAVAQREVTLVDLSIDSTPPRRSRSRKTRTMRSESESSEEEKEPSLKEEEKKKLKMYYLSLPQPYNVVPDQPAPSVADRRKACKDNLLKNGTGYSRWRSWFMAYFHKSKMPISAKCEALFKCLEENTKVERRRDGLEYDEDGYKQMLEFLEREYGDTRDLWQNFVSQLDALPVIKYNDYDELVDLEAIIETFISKVKKIGHPEDKCNLYKPISNKFTESLKHKLRIWINESDKDYSIENILKFLKNQIKCLRVDKPQKKTPRDQTNVINAKEDEESYEEDEDDKEKNLIGTLWRKLEVVPKLKEVLSHSSLSMRHLCRWLNVLFFKAEVLRRKPHFSLKIKPGSRTGQIT